MSDNKRMRDGKGYYIALVLCAAAIGITSYVFYRNADQAEQVSVEETYQDVLAGTLGTEDVPVLATQPQSQPQPSVPGAAKETVPAATEKKVLKTMWLVT